MNPTESAVFLEDRSQGKLVEATLVDCILPRHLQDVETKWKSFHGTGHEEHGHWDWRDKVSHISGQLSYQSFALECARETQGLMIVNTIKRCRLPEQANKHLVYVEYLAVAPWNRRAATSVPRYKGVGTVLIAAAIQLSRDEGNNGRVGLHSLPQSETFYRNVCQMTDLGPDPTYASYPLRYFEMTAEQANAFMQEKGGEHQ